MAHTILNFLGQDLGPGISTAPLGRDFEQVRSKGNGSGPHSEKRTSQDLADTSLLHDAIYYST